ncbi:MAG TPA: hypothetical protein VGE43_00370, partial [Acidimicrobiales bacterium]
MRGLRRGSALLLAAVLAVACADGSDEPPERAAVPSTSAPASTSTPAEPPTTAPPDTVPTAVTTDTCPEPPPRPAPDPDRPTYEVTMRADPDTGVVEGSQLVRFVPDLPVDRVVMRLWANGPRPASVGTAIELGTVELDGRPAPVTRPDPTTAVVELGRWAAPGEAIALRVPWRLTVGGPVNDRI